MKKLFYFLLIQILCSTFGWGQVYDTTKIESDSTFLYKKSFQKNTKYINSHNISFKHKELLGFYDVKSIGYNAGSLFVLNGYLLHYGSISFNQILPQKVNINDTLISNLTGYNSDFLMGIDIFNKTKNIDLALLLGFEFGRLRLYDNPLLRKKNGYFAPKIELQPKVKLKRLVIGGSFGYGYDISNPNWKNTWFSKNKNYSLDKLRQSGFSYQFFIGWSFS